MSKFFMLPDSSLVNVESIVSITPVTLGSASSLKNRPTLFSLYTPEQLEDLGLKRFRGYSFHHCSWDKAEDAVKESPETRRLSGGCPGYTELDAEPKFCDQYQELVDGKWCEHKDKNEKMFLKPELYKKVAYYLITVSSQIYGINGGSETFTISISTYKNIKNFLNSDRNTLVEV